MMGWLLAWWLAVGSQNRVVDVDLIEINTITRVYLQRDETTFRLRKHTEIGPSYCNFRRFETHDDISRYWVVDWCCLCKVELDNAGGGLVMARCIGHQGEVVRIRARAIMYSFGEDSELVERNFYPLYHQPRIKGLRN